MYRVKVIVVGHSDSIKLNMSVRRGVNTRLYLDTYRGVRKCIKTVRDETIVYVTLRSLGESKK